MAIKAILGTVQMLTRFRDNLSAFMHDAGEAAFNKTPSREDRIAWMRDLVDTLDIHPDLDALTQYHSQLIAAAYYPEIALDNRYLSRLEEAIDRETELADTRELDILTLLKKTLETVTQMRASAAKFVELKGRGGTYADFIVRVRIMRLEQWVHQGHLRMEENIGFYEDILDAVMSIPQHTTLYWDQELYDLLEKVTDNEAIFSGLAHDRIVHTIMPLMKKYIEAAQTEN